jgi:hypothetical protein
VLPPILPHSEAIMIFLHEATPAHFSPNPLKKEKKETETETERKKD